MTDVDRLAAAMERGGKTEEEVALAAEMDAASFRRRMCKNGEPFTVGQVRRMAAFIPLSWDEAQDIFLLQESQ